MLKFYLISAVCEFIYLFVRSFLIIHFRDVRWPKVKVGQIVTKWDQSRISKDQEIKIQAKYSF